MVAEKGADLIKQLWLQEEVVRGEAEAAGKTASVVPVIPVVQTATTANAYIPSAGAFDGYSAESRKIQVKAKANATAG